MCLKVVSLLRAGLGRPSFGNHFSAYEDCTLCLAAKSFRMTPKTARTFNRGIESLSLPSSDPKHLFRISM
jgi:hypothetical protein